MPAKTKDEIDRLKRDWERDGCWDIENTEGFEEHYQELLQYRLEVEREYKEKEDARISKLCESYGCNKELVKIIESLERRITQLEEQRRD